MYIITMKQLGERTDASAKHVLLLSAAHLDIPTCPYALNCVCMCMQHHYFHQHSHS